MKFCFFGFHKSFDFFKIGGCESYIRRLATQLIQRGNSVDYVFYGSKDNKFLSFSSINFRYFHNFNDALKSLEKHNYDHIITVYLLPKDRLTYMLFRVKYKSLAKFHFIYFAWTDSWMKRKILFSEARLLLYSGKLFCISKRQYDYMKKWTDKCVYLLPPVPENYFISPNEKCSGKKIKVTFLGRIDPGKGIYEVIDIFKALKIDKRFDLFIYGIYISKNKEAMKIHNWLKEQKNIKYTEVDRQAYSPETDYFVRNTLKSTDIFIQPYKKLSSSIDTPLLILEAMASLCTVITKPLGNLQEIYGQSGFLISSEEFVNNTVDFLKNITFDDLVEERKRLYKQNQKINFKSNNIGEKFLNVLNK